MTAPISRNWNPDPAQSGPAELRSEAPSLDELRAYALGLLARREYAQQDLASKLRRKWPPSAGCDARIADCLAQLASEGLLSEGRFAEAFVRARRRRGQGPLKIRAELLQRGVGEGLVSEHLGDGDGAWIGEALEWLERHDAQVTDRAGQARWYRRLLSRGFSHNQAWSALEQLGRRRTTPVRDS